MTGLLRQHGGGAAVLQLGLELGWLVTAVVLAVRYDSALPSLNVVAPALVFAVLMVGLNAAFGLYRRDRPLPFGEYVLRQTAALIIGLPIVYVSSHVLPGGLFFQQAFVPVVLIALGGLLAVRQIMVSTVARTLLPYRVLVLGTGPEALAVETSLEVANPHGLELAGFYPLEQVPARSIAASRIVSNHLTLEETVKHLGIDEIIVAVREQRGGVLPLRALLECRLSGIQITDLARFFERVHGRVPIDSLKASWLIYGKGFRQTWLRSFVKRGFDIIVTAVLLPIALPIMGAMAFLISLEGGTPIIYRQERVGYRGQKFTLLKFRSMTHDAEKDGQAFWASINDTRITAVGRFMRRTRIDELPQLINVLFGDMSIVGPRPSLPSEVASYEPWQYRRFAVRPGLTCHWQVCPRRYQMSFDEWMRLDLKYVDDWGLRLDLDLIRRTVGVVLRGTGK